MNPEGGPQRAPSWKARQLLEETAPVLRTREEAGYEEEVRNQDRQQANVEDIEAGAGKQAAI